MSGNPDKEELKQSILSALALIPEGRVVSYGELARLSGNPGYARYVGYILSRLPADTQLPWHRVVNAQGRISFPKNTPKFLRQKTLLEGEGLRVKSGRLSIKQCGLFAK